MNAEEITMAIKSCLDKMGLHYEHDEDKDIIHFGLNIDGKLGNVRYIIGIRNACYNVYAICNLKADEDCRLEVMKYLTMANSGLRYGNFELDLQDGEVCFKTYVDCDDPDSIPEETVIHSIITPSSMFERYGNGLAALLMGFSDAETEIEKAEAD